MLYHVDVNVNVKSGDIISGVTKLTVKVEVEAESIEDAEQAAEELMLDSVYVGSINVKQL